MQGNPGEIGVLVKDFGRPAVRAGGSSDIAQDGADVDGFAAVINKIFAESLHGQKLAAKRRRRKENPTGEKTVGK